MKALTKPWEITDEQLKASRKWWRGLSINEEKSFIKKYYPAFSHDLNLFSQMPSFVFSVYEQETQ